MEQLKSLKQINDQLRYFQSRDKQLAEHLQKIENRDAKIYSYFTVMFFNLINLEPRASDLYKVRKLENLKNRIVGKHAGPRTKKKRVGKRS